MSAIKSAFWDEINAAADALETRRAIEGEPDVEEYAEYQLREAIAEARKRLGKDYTREIIEAELS